MIVESAIVWDLPQIDGRRFIRERHVDDKGVEYFFDYMAEEKEDSSVILPERVSTLERALADAEAQRAALALAEKERAVVILKLADEDIQKVLMVSAEELQKAKEELTNQAESVAEVEVVNG